MSPGEVPEKQTTSIWLALLSQNLCLAPVDEDVSVILLSTHLVQHITVHSPCPSLSANIHSRLQSCTRHTGVEPAPPSWRSGDAAMMMKQQQPPDGLPAESNIRTASMLVHHPMCTSVRQHKTAHKGAPLTGAAGPTRLSMQQYTTKGVASWASQAALLLPFQGAAVACKQPAIFLDGRHCCTQLGLLHPAGLAHVSQHHG